MCFHFWFCLFSWITSSTIGLQLSPIAAGIKTFKSIIKKKKEKHNKRVLLAKSKLNVIKVLISKTLTDSVISYDEFVLINNILKEYNEIKEEMKKKKDVIKFILFIRQCYYIAWTVEEIQQVKIQKYFHQNV